MNLPGGTVASYNRAPFWVTVTRALVRATPLTDGAKPRREPGSMRTSVASLPPIKLTLSKKVPSVHP